VPVQLKDLPPESVLSRLSESEIALMAQCLVYGHSFMMQVYEEKEEPDAVAVAIIAAALYLGACE